jgi:hypothetical protein
MGNSVHLMPILTHIQQSCNWSLPLLILCITNFKEFFINALKAITLSVMSFGSMRKRQAVQMTLIAVYRSKNPAAPFACVLATRSLFSHPERRHDVLYSCFRLLLHFWNLLASFIVVSDLCIMSGIFQSRQKLDSVFPAYQCLLGGKSFTAFWIDLLSIVKVQGVSNMTGTNCDLFTHSQSRSYLNHLVE